MIFNVKYFFEAKITSLIPCTISSDFFNINILDHTLFFFLTFTQMAVPITTCSSIFILVNSWWPSNTIRRHRFGSTLAYAMVCCLKAPNHCLNQYWLGRNVSPTSNFKEMPKNLIHNLCSIILLNSYHFFHSPMSYFIQQIYSIYRVAVIWHIHR